MAARQEGSRPIARARPTTAGPGIRLLAVTNLWPPMPGGTGQALEGMLADRADTTVLVPTAARPQAPAAPPWGAQVRPVLRFSGRAGGAFKVRSALQHLEIVVAPLVSCAVRRALRPNLMVCVQPLFAGAGGLLASRLFGIPYIVLVHGEELVLLHRDRFLFGLRRRLQATVIANAAAVLCNSRHSRTLAATLYGVPDTRLAVIYPSIAAAEGPPGGRDPRATALRDPVIVPIDSAARVILMAGRLAERHKGFDTAVEAMPAIVRAVPAAQLVIAGPGDATALQARARALGVADHVRFVGRVERNTLDALFGRCELFLLPGREVDGAAEGFGIVFLEAGRAGKPVVAGNTGGAPEAVVDGETGLLVDGRSPAAVAGTVLRIMGDPRLAERLGRRGRERVLREFDGRRQHDEFDRLVRRVLGGEAGTTQ